jgi:hypothetical protein
LTREDRCPRREWLWVIGLSNRFYLDKHPGFYYHVIKEGNTLSLEWRNSNMTSSNRCRIAEIIGAGLSMDLPSLYSPEVEEAMQEHSLSVVAAYLYVNSFY